MNPIPPIDKKLRADIDRATEEFRRSLAASSHFGLLQVFNEQMNLIDAMQPSSNPGLAPATPPSSATRAASDVPHVPQAPKKTRRTKQEENPDQLCPTQAESEQPQKKKQRNRMLELDDETRVHVDTLLSGFPYNPQ